MEFYLFSQIADIDNISIPVKFISIFNEALVRNLEILIKNIIMLRRIFSNVAVGLWGMAVSKNRLR